MKNWVNKNRVYFCSPTFFFMNIICAFFQLQSMDKPEYFVEKKAVALKVILMARPDIFNRKMIYCLSQVSVDCEKIIRETVKYRKNFNEDYRAWILNSDNETRKQYFIKCAPELKLVKDLVWNRHGTACAKASFGSMLPWTLYQGARPERLSRVKEVMLERRSFFNADFVGNCAVWDSFYDVLPHQPAVCFDGNFDVYVHACGSERKQDPPFSVQDPPFEVDVLEYRLSSDLGTGASVCKVEIDGEIYPLAVFLEFPRLLKAFLESSEIQFSVGFVRKIFLLKGVKLPEHYDECKPYYKEARYYTSFEELPKEIRKPLIVHYLAQIGKPKKRKWACFG